VAAAVAAQASATMRAIVQSGYGSADVLHLREINKPVVSDDRVLVRVHAASVNAIDCHFVQGEIYVRPISGLRGPKRHVRGVDLAGRVEAVGKNVTRFKPGDEVFGGGSGTFAEYASALEGSLVPKPLQLSFEQAGAVFVAGCTALEGLRDKGHLQAGQRVLINGAGGGVGTFSVQIAKALGARVTAVTSTKNLEIVRSLGPDEVIDYTQEDFTRRERRYDVVLDVAAHRSLGDLRHLLTPDGTLVAVGMPKGSALAVLGRIVKMLVLSRLGGQRIVGFMARADHQDLVLLKELIVAGKLCPVIDRTYPLSEVPDAIRYVGSGQARAKVVITVS
jgi:NADPH:quinone reductase-like Zn-dependent oxidoreductase